MEKINKKLFAAFMGIIFGLALSGCQNPFLQLDAPSHTGNSVSAHSSSTGPVYTVSFVTNGGAEIPQITNVASGSLISEPSSAKDHYMVESWFTEAGLTNVWDFASDTVNSNITLYAKWVFDGNLGSGTAIDPFIVYNLDTLNRVGREITGENENPWDTTKHYLQIEDITYTGAGWNPIGNSVGGNFSGTYRGDGHTISGIHIKSTFDHVGFFRELTSGAKVEDLGLLNVDIVGGYETGGIAGVSNGIIKNCYVTGSIGGGNAETAGIAGFNDDNGTIENCYAVITLQGGDQSGGIAGINYGVILGSYAMGEVSGLGDLGGVTGINYGEISNCFFIGVVNGTDNNIGGIAGSNNGPVNKCFAMGSVSGQIRVGGIVGDNNGPLVNCVSLCESINATGNFGRVFGSPNYLSYPTTNYACLGMVVNGVENNSTGNSSGVDGVGIPDTQYESETWWKDSGTWSSPWDFVNVWAWDDVNNRPMLK